ncbi:LacI family DNA-binding transcriptional regulator [Pseudarthrobacter oxydans]|uniref:LacI family DNA-binding transcriptional regulator n=1 Tax=Pseudarthrobacter oxydans TaxID=1671 RepID=UPI0038281A52
MAATLKDVASEAGVSLATASRAFKDTDLLATGTRQKVLDAAIKVGYEIPKLSRSKTIAVIVPDIANAVYAAFIKSVQDKAWPERHRMLLADTGEDPARELAFMRELGKDVDGIVICSPRSIPKAITEAVGEIPLVVVNGTADHAPSVLMDVRQGLRQAVEHLYSLGHHHIAFVPGPANAWANRTRLGTLTDLAAEWEMELTVVGNQAASVQGGLAAAAAVAATGATAVIAYNDLVALGLQAGARSLGLRCPEDLSIMGIDDLDVAAVSDPGLTSIRVAIRQSGALSLELLLELIAGKTPEPSVLSLDSQLIVRGSVKSMDVTKAGSRNGQYET